MNCTEIDEAETTIAYFDKYPYVDGETICLDATGFIRPHLLFFLRYLFENKCPCIDVIYSEPAAYQEGSGTRFSSPVREIRQVRGYEGSHGADSGGDYLIIGCGYDTSLMAAVANNLYQATKVQMFPFPALRPHMYQENRLRTQMCESAFGRVLQECYAPGYDPFATAGMLSAFFHSNRSQIKNLYLSPLATKAQVLGFAIFYLMECIGENVSIIFPFSDGYNHESSIGISEIWKYQMDFELMHDSSPIRLS